MLGGRSATSLTTRQGVSSISSKTLRYQHDRARSNTQLGAETIDASTVYRH
jgi:hypothetical protein